MDDFETGNHKVVEQWRAQSQHRAERAAVMKVVKSGLFLLVCAAFLYGLRYLVEQLS